MEYTAEFRLRLLAFLGAGLAFAVTLATAFSTPAMAQDAAFGEGVWLHEANCADCHGWLANGVAEDPRAPRGANLRETTLTEEQIAEVIMCGRPGTGMPAFDPKAYTDARCYGVTRADLGDMTPAYADFTLTRRHATGLAKFILSEFAGRGEPTAEDCMELLGAENSRCALLPKRAP